MVQTGRDTVTRMLWRDPSAAPADRVTAVETFFDVVFVFTLTQLTRTLEAQLTLASLGRILLVFVALWYMYGGYAWLTNHVPPRRVSQKLILFAGMAGFFITAIAIPRVFDDTGILFGAGYALVVAVHLVLFTQADAREGVLRLAPYNACCAACILAAGFTSGRPAYALWIAGLLCVVALPYLMPRLSWVGAARTFHVSAGHFVERHGLLVMIALGESVIAIGMGADITHLTAWTIAVIILALALPGALWWTYFTDNHAAESALAEADTARRSLLSYRAFYIAHIPMLLGIVVVAAGIHSAIAHPAEPAHLPAAAALAGGAALFLAGMADFVRCLSIGAPRSRFIGAALALATLPIGLHLTAGVQLAAVLAVVVGMLWMSRRQAAGVHVL